MLCSTTPRPTRPPSIQRWLVRHPRFSLHFTPTYSSWLNLVERWFAELTTKKLRGATHRCVRDLNADIRAWIETWNDNPKPFVWTKTADQILESIARYCARINDSRHGGCDLATEVRRSRDRRLRRELEATEDPRRVTELQAHLARVRAAVREFS
jgi:hypothetical protein